MPRAAPGSRHWERTEYGRYRLRTDPDIRLLMEPCPRAAYYAAHGIAMDDDRRERWVWLLERADGTRLGLCYRAGHDRPPFMWALRLLREARDKPQ